MVDLMGGAELAQPVKEVRAAVNGSADHVLTQNTVGGFHIVLDGLLPYVGHADLLMPLGIDREEGVGIVGVAAQHLGLLYENDLLTGLCCLDRSHKAAAAAHDNDVGLLLHPLMGRHLHDLVRIVDGLSVTHLGAQAALHTFIRVDLILHANIVDRLHGTLHAAVVAADAVGLIDLKHTIRFLLTTYNTLFLLMLVHRARMHGTIIISELFRACN